MSLTFNCNLVTFMTKDKLKFPQVMRVIQEHIEAGLYLDTRHENQKDTKNIH